jgi:hypothetical protein
MPVSKKPRKPNAKWKSKVPNAAPTGDHAAGNGWYHPTLGWRISRKSHSFHLLNTLLMPLGVFVD